MQYRSYNILLSCYELIDFYQGVISKIPHPESVTFVIIRRYPARAIFNSLRHVALSYSWIGYLQANDPPRVLLPKIVDHAFPCTHRGIAVSSNRFVPWLLPDTVRCFPCYSWQKSAFRR